MNSENPILMCKHFIKNPVHSRIMCTLDLNKKTFAWRVIKGAGNLMDLRERSGHFNARLWNFQIARSSRKSLHFSPPPVPTRNSEHNERSRPDFGHLFHPKEADLLLEKKVRRERTPKNRRLDSHIFRLNGTNVEYLFFLPLPVEPDDCTCIVGASDNANTRLAITCTFEKRANCSRNGDTTDKPNRDYSQQRKKKKKEVMRAATLDPDAWCARSLCRVAAAPLWWFRTRVRR